MFSMDTLRQRKHTFRKVNGSKCNEYVCCHSSFLTENVPTTHTTHIAQVLEFLPAETQLKEIGQLLTTILQERTQMLRRLEHLQVRGREGRREGGREEEREGGRIRC